MIPKSNRIGSRIELTCRYSGNQEIYPPLIISNPFWPILDTYGLVWTPNNPNNLKIQRKSQKIPLYPPQGAPIVTASRGNWPPAVSPESITQSVPSSTAFATSPASARVGRGAAVIDSSICVAVMTGFPIRLHFAIMTKGPRTDPFGPLQGYGERNLFDNSWSHFGPRIQIWAHRSLKEFELGGELIEIDFGPWRLFFCWF